MILSPTLKGGVNYFEQYLHRINFDSYKYDVSGLKPFYPFDSIPHPEGWG
jgi:hypothetical protein